MTITPKAPSSLWFQPATAEPEAALRLFLFPHAGSGASIYKDWPPLLPRDVAHHCVQLPGRQNRSGEETFTDMAALIEALREALLDELDERPFAFFGHCMGAQIAYRLTLLLERNGDRTPVLLGVSGWAPRGFQTPTMEQAAMPIEELIGWIRTLGSVPTEIVDDSKALDAIIPAMRADLTVVAGYRDDGAEIGCCPVVSYSGRDDQLMESGAMKSWRDRAAVYLGNSEFAGDHFYMNVPENTAVLTSDLVRHIRKSAPVPG